MINRANTLRNIAAAAHGLRQRPLSVTVLPLDGVRKAESDKHAKN